MQASRLLSILMLLQARGRMTAGALAQALEVSTRTILRDIDGLSAAGVPIWGERGQQGGFQLREGWSTELTGMTEPEAQALLLAGLPGAATELGLGAAAASARMKMVASLPGAWREQAARVGERLHIDPIDWYRAADTPNFLREVADAVWHTRRITVTYDSWRGVSQRELEPLGLVLKAGAWYLVARGVGLPGQRVPEPRTYRLASMLAFKGVGRSFRRPRQFDLVTTWSASARRFEADLRKVPVRLLASPRALYLLKHQRLQHQVLPQHTAANSEPAGWREVLLPVESVEQGAKQLLGWGDVMQVLHPPELRAELRRLAQAVLNRHED